MEAMAKLHTYYVTNATTKMNYTHSNLSEEELYKTFNESLNFTEFSDEIREQEEEFDFIEDNDEDFAEENETEIPNKNNEIIIENYFDFNNQEFQKALKIDVKVIIEETEYIDHGNKNFDINAILDANLN